MLFHSYWGGYYNSLILQALELLPGQAERGSHASIEISYKIWAFGYPYLVHYTMLFHNSLILQALELFPGKRSKPPGTIG